MGANCEWPCWKIMNCDKSEKCPAKSRPETPCWEIAKESSDYRHNWDICTDCIVHMLRDDNPALTKKEIKLIMNRKENCVLA